jgi:GLPGLI family protein
LYGQYNLKYTLKKQINNRKFEADGLLKIDAKEKKSIFYLSQYKNLISKNYELKKNGDTLKVLHNNNICQDKKGYFYDFKNKQRTLLLYDVVCDSKTLTTDKIVYPQWKIEKKQFKYKQWDVYRAFAKINDRNWTVLFTKEYNEIQFFGPWLFVGLPGLVISASEDTNTYFFEFNKIEKNSQIAITQPKFPRKASLEKYIIDAINANKKRIIKKISAEYNIPEKDVDLSKSPKYETLDFIEK